MKKNISLIIVSIITIMIILTFIIYNMNSNQDKKSGTETITLKINEEKKIFDNLKLKYLSFGHENSSSSPFDEFSATVEVYYLEISKNNTIEKITIYQDINSDSQSTEWQNYKILLMKPLDQEKITLSISKQEK